MSDANHDQGRPAARPVAIACAGLIYLFLGAMHAPAAAQESPSAIANEQMSPEEIENAIANADGANVGDPWEGFNRKMFAAHNVLDKNLLVPASLAYRAATPKSGRRGIRRFLANFRTPGVFINDLLQGEFKRAGQTMSRFVINSTIGAGGFADPAAQLGIPGHSEDFGQTLATWGVGSGPYLFIPLFGPSSIRDAAGIGVQTGLDPLFYARSDIANIARNTRGGVGGLSAREPLIEPLREIEENSLDYYASFRSFYQQARMREINNGRTNFDDLPDIGEFEEFDELE